MLDTVLGNPWVRAAALLVTIVLVFLLVYLLSPVLVPLFFAFLVAYVLDPIVDFFEVRRIPRGVTIAGVVAVAILVLLAIPVVIIPSMVNQANTLIEAATAAPKDATEKAEHVEPAWYDRYLNLLPVEWFVETVGWGTPDMDAEQARAILSERIGTEAKEFFQRYKPQLTEAGRTAGASFFRFFKSIGNSVVSFLVFLGNFALFAFVAGYLLKDFDGVIQSAKGLVPPRRRERVFDVVGKIDLQVRSFLRGQLLVCLCLGIMYAIGLTVCGVPFGLLIAIFGGFANLVPYLGIALTSGPAVLLTLLQHGLDWHVLGVVVTFVVAQMIEGTLLTPNIVGEKVGLHPVWVILAIMVFSSAFGFLGLLIAVPLAAALKVLVLEGLDYYRRSPVFGESGDQI